MVMPTPQQCSQCGETLLGSDAVTLPVRCSRCRLSTAVVHVASKIIDWVQRCVLCGAVLRDYRNAAWPSDQPTPQGCLTSIGAGHGQRAKNTAAVEAAAELLNDRGWDAYVYYKID